jgi:hypothetical protein
LYPWLEPQERFTLLLKALARGDEAEALRLHGTCPRRSYTRQDGRFHGRVSLSFEIVTLVYADLRCVWGRLQALHWAMGVVHGSAADRHVDAALAFLEGGRCARGLPQMAWFPDPTAAAGGGPPVGEDSAGAAPTGSEADPQAPDRPRRVGEAAAEDQVRMVAVQERAEHATRLMLDAISGAAKGVAQDLVNTWEALGRFCDARLGVGAAELLTAWGFPVEELRTSLGAYESLEPREAKVRELLGVMRAHWDERFGEGKGGGPGR